MAFVGYVFRKDSICKDLVIGAVYGKRGNGRPKTRYSDNIREFGGNRSFADLYRLAQNRDAWRATAVQLNELPVYSPCRMPLNPFKCVFPSLHYAMKELGPLYLSFLVDHAPQAIRHLM